MLDFPILRAEARISSRQASTYAKRAWYGLLLLWIFWTFHHSQEEWSGGRLLANNELARFAAAAFEWLAVGQALIVMALLPAMVAGSVAEERTRQTLPALLATRFSSAAIILNKLGAKMLQIGVFLAVGLPIACLLGLLGGIDPRSITYAYSGTALNGLFPDGSFAACLGVRSRTAKRDPARLSDRDLLALRSLDRHVAMSMGARRSFGALAAVNDWILPTTPLSLVTSSTLAGWNGRGLIAWLLETLRMIAPGGLTPGWTGPGALSVALGRMIVWQLAFGAVFLFWASWRLRPVARRLADGPRRRAVPRRTVPDRLARPAATIPCSGKSAPPEMVARPSSVSGSECSALASWSSSVTTPSSHNYRRALNELFAYGYAGRPITTTFSPAMTSFPS